MQRRIARTRCLILAIGLVPVLAPSANAVITRLTPLKEVLSGEQLIFMATVEAVDSDKPAMVLKVSEPLKARPPFGRMPVNLSGDSEAQKEKHTPQLLKRVAPQIAVVVFASKRGQRYTAFGYSNGTWFQMIGHVSDDPATVRWAFTHCEPYLRRTFKGTTAELRQAILDGLTGKKPPPKPDEKEKPGLGPELPAKKSELRHAISGPLFAVIPSVFVLGPLALLATLFPAIFGGILRRWTALLSVVSLVSTLYVVHSLLRGYIKDYWWSSLWSLWLIMALISLGGTVWAWRRYRATVQAGLATELLPRRGEVIILCVLSLVGLGVVALCLSGGTLLEAPWKELLVLWLVGWVGTAYVLYLRRMSKRGTVRSHYLPAEVIMLATLGLGCAGVGAASLPKNSAAGSVDVVWRYETEDRGTITSSPLVSGEHVFVAVAHAQGLGKYGCLVCLDRDTGKQLWRFNDNDAMKQVFSTPCLAGDRLFIGEGFHEDHDCKLYCLDARTGAKLWEFQTSSHTESSPCVTDDKVYFGAGDDGVYCLNAADGHEVWHFPGLHVDSSPVMVDGRLYAGSGVGDRFNTTELLCLDAATGQPLWRLPIDLPAFGAPTVGGDQVFFGIGNGDFLKSAPQPRGAVLCVRAADGQRRWRYDLPDAVHGKPALDANHVYAGCRDHHVYCLDRAEGQLRWTQDLGSAVVASPAIHAGRLIVAASGGRLSCLTADRGEIVWSFDVAQFAQENAQLLSSPQVGAGNRIYFGAGIGNAIAGAPTLLCLEEK